MGEIVIGGVKIRNAPNEMVNTMISRDAFVNKYCEEKKWDRETLTIEQILEIRAQEGWKSAK